MIKACAKYIPKKKIFLVFRVMDMVFCAAVAFPNATIRDPKRKEIRLGVFLVIVSGVHFQRFRRRENETRTNTKRRCYIFVENSRESLNTWIEKNGRFVFMWVFLFETAANERLHCFFFRKKYSASHTTQMVGNLWFVFFIFPCVDNHACVSGADEKVTLEWSQSPSLLSPIYKNIFVARSFSI